MYMVNISLIRRFLVCRCLAGILTQPANLHKSKVKDKDPQCYLKFKGPMDQIISSPFEYYLLSMFLS